MNTTLQELVEYQPVPGSTNGNGNGNGNGHASGPPVARATTEATPAASGRVRGVFRDRGVRAKVLAAPLVILVLFAVVGGMAIVRMGGLAEDTREVEAEVVQPQSAAAAARSSFLMLRVHALYHVLHEDPAAKRADEEAFQAAHGEVVDAVGQLQALTLPEGADAQVETFGLGAGDLRRGGRGGAVPVEHGWRHGRPWPRPPSSLATMRRRRTRSTS